MSVLFSWWVDWTPTATVFHPDCSCPVCPGQRSKLLHKQTAQTSFYCCNCFSWVIYVVKFIYFQGTPVQLNATQYDIPEIHPTFVKAKVNSVSVDTVPERCWFYPTAILRLCCIGLCYIDGCVFPPTFTWENKRSLLWIMRCYCHPIYCLPKRRAPGPLMGFMCFCTHHITGTLQNK